MRALAEALTASPEKPNVSAEPREARQAAEIQIAASRRMEDVAAQIAAELGKVAIERERELVTKTVFDRMNESAPNCGHAPEDI